jgi:hypothetical protein
LTIGSAVAICFTAVMVGMAALIASSTCQDMCVCLRADVSVYYVFAVSIYVCLYFCVFA